MFGVDRRLVGFVALLVLLPQRAPAETRAERSTVEVLVADARDRTKAGDMPGAVKRLATAYGVIADPEIGLELGRALAKSGDTLRAVAILREVAAVRGGGQKKRATIQAAQAEASALAKKLAWLEVHVTIPPGQKATLLVDEKEIAPGTFVLQDPGKHRVTLRGEGLATVERDIELQAGKKESIRMETSPPPPAATTGKLVVEVSGGRSASLLVDGKRVGALPYTGGLPPGDYRIRAEGKGVRSAEQTVKIAVGGEQRVSLTLTESTGRLQITTPYPGASIYVDGELVGQGTFRGEAIDGEHEVTVTLEGFYPQTKTVRVIAGKPALLAISSLVSVGRGSEQENPYRGSYVRIGPAFLVGANAASDTLSTDCLPQASCSAKSPLGLGLRLGVGWSFGVIGAEYFMLGVVDRWNVDVAHPQNRPFPRTENYTFYRYGGAAGAALRASSRGTTFRVSGALGGALAIRATQFQRSTEHTTPNVKSKDFTGKSGLLLAPALTADFGVLIGSTPGPKLFAGILAYAELSPFSTPGSKAIQEDFGGESPALDYVTGSQFFIGPMLGVQLGR